jgi:hypothetical protein
MSIKVLIKFEGNIQGAEEKSTKLTIPKSWSTKTVGDVIGLFTKAYNAKSEVQLNKDEMHLLSESNEKIYSDSTISSSLGDHHDYILKPGKCIKHVTTEVEIQLNAAGKPYVKCKNYGCQQMFDEDSNTDESCNHHTGPPIFHETVKYWSCCPNNKAYDFDNFQLLKTCNKGLHTTADPSVAIHSRHTVFDGVASASTEKVEEAPLKSIADFNKNDDGPTAASEFGRILRQERKSSRHASDGTAKCQRKGCGQTFIVENNTIDNGGNDCCYHEGQPVFHDAVKFWSCCSEKKCYDFDTFLAVPGCAKGLHDDGVIDI